MSIGVLLDKPRENFPFHILSNLYQISSSYPVALQLYNQTLRQEAKHDLKQIILSYHIMLIILSYHIMFEYSRYLSANKLCICSITLVDISQIKRDDNSFEFFYDKDVKDLNWYCTVYLKQVGAGTRSDPVNGQAGPS